MNSNIELRFEYPWLLLLLLPALALVLVPWLRLPKAGRRGASRILPAVLHGLLAAVLLAPICEELAMRGIILQRSRRVFGLCVCCLGRIANILWKLL